MTKDLFREIERIAVKAVLLDVLRKLNAVRTRRQFQAIISDLESRLERVSRDDVDA